MADDGDLWFLPGPPEDIAPTDPPWEVAQQKLVFAPKDWLRAEAAQGRGLARAAAAFARLDAQMSTGFAKRLALAETSALLWTQGDWLPVEKITLYGLLRESSLKDAQGLSLADWAQRRLLGAGLPEDLAAFLGRRRAEFDGLEDFGQHPVGIEFDGLESDWHAARRGLEEAHPITQAAGLFAAWRAFGLSEPGAAVEAGVAATKIGAAEGRALRFLPVASGGPIGQGGAVADRLARWYGAVENACLQAEMQHRQLNTWAKRAEQATAGLSGKTPALLIEALQAVPALSAGMVAHAGSVANIGQGRKDSINRTQLSSESKKLRKAVPFQTKLFLADHLSHLDGSVANFLT
ncbi:MAG: hypothetical protein COB08_002480 [Rhodobacteraceae bacterium]|nr:hypothetical protein [Paracoccaceae bacterium]